MDLVGRQGRKARGSSRFYWKAEFRDLKVPVPSGWVAGRRAQPGKAAAPSILTQGFRFLLPPFCSRDARMSIDGSGERRPAVSLAIPLLLIRPFSISTKAAKNNRRSLDFAALCSG